ncbi:hypothetical protein NQU17_12870 [Clostridiaceae bacterium HFYG-1003]|nr:hypothetical protein NQU17_12870 [Clostridiaceae bacterium HFYG-1003]
MNRFIKQVRFEFKELRGLWLLPILLFAIMAALSPNQASRESKRYVIMVYQLIAPLIVSLSVLYVANKFYDAQTGELIQTFHPQHHRTKVEVLIFFSGFYLICSLTALLVITRRQSLVSYPVFLQALLQQIVFIVIGITGLKYTKDLVAGIFLVMGILSIHIIGNVPFLLYTRPVMLYPSGYLEWNPLLLLILSMYLLALTLVNRFLPKRW